MTFVPDVMGTIGPTFGSKNYSNVQEVSQGSVVVTPFVKVIRSGARDADGNLPPEVWRQEELAPTLNQFDVGDTRATAVAVSGFYPHSSGRAGFGIHDNLSPTITVGTGLGIPSPPGVFDENLAVRRLTPRECERLMGWPDDWTRWDSDGKEVADSQRYKMCGNGVVSNVTEWFGRRLPA